MLRYLNKEEKIKSRKLYEEVFEDTKRFTDFYFAEYLEKNQILVNFHDSDIISMMHLIPNNVTIKGEDTVLFYIFAVATRKDFRKKGYMEAMINKAINDLYLKGTPLCYLIPENAKTYKKFGFSTIREKLIAIADIEKKEYDFDDFYFREFMEEDKELLIKFFNNLVAPYMDFYKTRNSEYFKNMMKKVESENGSIEIMFCNDKISGYAFVSNEEEVLVPEIISQKDMEKNLILHICEKYNTERLKEISPELMIRVIRPEEMVRFISSNKDFVTNIKLNDDIVKENNKVFCLKVDREKGEMSFTEEKEDIEIDISDFGEWIFGKSVRNDLPQIFPISKIHLNEIL